ncbi:MAG: Rpn family recombination-promoting nuclease/putative transposase [Bacteroidota bacterium]
MQQKNQPHDRFIKALMENVDFAKKLFKTQHINPEVAQEMDWDTLELWDTALVGEHNKQIYADVVYRVFTKNQQEAFIIFNHERKPDRTLPIRRLEYKLGTLKKAIKQHKQPALIYFITWYNGPAPYPYERSITDYFTRSQLADKLLVKDEIVVVKEIPDEELSKHGEVSILEVFMKHGDNPHFPQWLIAHPEIAQQLAENKYIERSIEYLLEVGHHKEEDLLAAFEKTSNKLKQTMLTTKQQIEKRGLEQGLEQGIQQGLEKTAKQMLEDGEPMEKIKKWTGLSREKLEQL